MGIDKMIGLKSMLAILKTEITKKDKNKMDEIDRCFSFCYLCEKRFMIIYNVTVSIEYEVQDEWLEWMKSVHIPEVLATGKFMECRMSKILAEEEGGAAYSIQYLCENMETLNSYQKEHAPELQRKHQEKYGTKALAFRTLLDIVHIERTNG